MSDDEHDDEGPLSPKHKAPKDVPQSTAPKSSPRKPVGRGRPPREHQFQPGRSGNPRGRPKGAKSTADILMKMLSKKINVTSGGKRQKIAVKEAMLLRIVETGLKGDLKAAGMVFKLDEGTAVGSVADKDAQSDESSEEIIAKYLARLGQKKSGK